MTTATAPACGLSDAELAVIEARLHVSGLFVAHAHSDMTRLLAEIRRLRAARTPDPSQCEEDPMTTTDDRFSRPELPEDWTGDAYWRSAVHILAAFGDDGRVWDHVSPNGIRYPAMLAEGWSSGERRVLRAAAALWDDSPVSPLDVLSGVSDRYWQLIVEAAQMLRDGLR